MSEKVENYVIYITIIEGRHFDILNMDSVVHIRVGKQRKSTSVRKSTDSPYFNEYFVFEFNEPLSKFLDNQVVLTVIQPRKLWTIRKTLGQFYMDVAAIWAAPDHQFYHKWVTIIAGPGNKKPGLKGYLKIDIGILTIGKVPKFPVHSEDITGEDDIEGNLLASDNMAQERTRANYVFNIYNANDIPKVKNKCCKKVMETETTPSTYVQITFAGIKGKTSVKKFNSNPVWNEKIVINEIFPSLSQRIKIELMYVQNHPPAVHYIYLRSICNDGENGYLPTFGPSYIYLYTSEMTEMNYCGKLLLEVKTEIMTDLMWSVNSVEVHPLKQIPIFNYWKIENVLLFCNIYAVRMIDKKYSTKNITFELTMGAPLVEEWSFHAANFTQQMKPTADNINEYYFLPYAGKVMCTSILVKLENASVRILNTNMIRKIYILMRDEMLKVEAIFEKNYKKQKPELQVLFVNIAEKVETNCRIYLTLVKAYDTPKVELDRKKLEFCIREMEDIEANIKKITYYESKKKVFRKLLSILYRIYTLIDDVQNCWPDVFIWMLYNNKRVGYHRVQVKDIIFSTNTEERGLFCGSMQYVYIKPLDKKKALSSFGEYSIILSRLYVQLWVGLQEHSSQGLNSVINCFQPKSFSKYEIPTILSCEDIIAIPKTISPVWNETIIFKNIPTFGCMEFLTENIPHVVVEAFDLDKSCCQCTKPIYEFLGRSDFIPKVFSEDILPQLHWQKIYDGDRLSGEVLMAAIITINSNDGDGTSYDIVDDIPDFIRPIIKLYRLDVYFWCVNDLKRVSLMKILRPKITIECSGVTLHSSTLTNTKKYLHFPKPHQFIGVQLPVEEEFYPPLSIRMFDVRGFGYMYYVGTHNAEIKDYLYKPYTAMERLTRMTDGYVPTISDESSQDTVSSIVKEIHFNSDLKRTSIDFDIKKFKLANMFLYNKLKEQMKKRKAVAQIQSQTQTSDIIDNLDKIDIADIDWWTKFYMSAEHPDSFKNDPLKKKLKIMIYPSELENLEEFNHFNDMFHKFKLYRGKRTGDDILDEENIIATFKAAIRIYEWPPEAFPEEYVTETGHQIEDGAFQHYPANEQIPFAVRVYIVRCFNLRPKDASGKSDPYIVVKLGDNKKVTDVENYIANNVNPTFGRSFELKGAFPNDSYLTVAIWDKDVASRDDLIGETKIDIENRLYTNHRANCGLPVMYIDHGPCMWRDQHKPSHILYGLCKQNKIDGPDFYDQSVKVGPRFFYDETLEGGITELNKEKLSLLVLNRWKEIPIIGCSLVPEHVETRSLYHYKVPGIEQGKIQLWVDIFPCADAALPPMVDIKPRAPLPYELRCIIWNTQDVLLDEDDFFVGQKKSDIYVKGWLAKPEESQTTDVHYNSLTGEGNFNWRFIFPFAYIAAEDKMVIKETTSIFSEETELKVPCVFNLQVWDNDTISANDFIGSVQLSLAHLPRGSKTPKLCTLNMLKPGASTVNLFKTKRHRGWWPFRGRKEGKKGIILAGKVEAEFHLLTEDEAKLSPAGIAREEPQALPPPKRPDTSFNWLTNPWKALKFLLCVRFRKQICCLVFTGLIFFFIAVALYSVPNYLVKKLLNA